MSADELTIALHELLLASSTASLAMRLLDVVQTSSTWADDASTLDDARYKAALLIKDYMEERHRAALRTSDTGTAWFMCLPDGTKWLSKPFETYEECVIAGANCSAPGAPFRVERMLYRLLDNGRTA